MALQQGHDQVVATLLDRDTRRSGGLPALHVAARKDDVNAANLLLLSPDANVNHQSQVSPSPSVANCIDFVSFPAWESALYPILTRFSNSYNEVLLNFLVFNLSVCFFV